MTKCALININKELIQKINADDASGILLFYKEKNIIYLYKNIVDKRRILI